MTIQIIKLTTFLFLFFASLLVHADAQCPKYCYCSKAIAENLCGLSFLIDNCEIGRCRRTDCRLRGWRCREKVRTVPSLISALRVEKIRQKIEENGGCKSNNCFAIDGSGSINAASFQNELKFVADVAHIISVYEARVAATQYDTRNYPIYELGENFTKFDKVVKQAGQQNGFTDRISVSSSTGAANNWKNLRDSQTT